MPSVFRRKQAKTDWVMAADLGLTYPSNRKPDRPLRPLRTPSEELVEAILCDIMGPLDRDLCEHSSSLEVDIGMCFADRVELVMELEEKLAPFLPELIDDELAEGWETVGDVIHFVEHTLRTGVQAAPDRPDETLQRVRDADSAGTDSIGDSQSGEDRTASLQ